MSELATLTTTNARVVEHSDRRIELAFDNGYGASVVNDGYGSHAGLYELAVLHDRRLCYTTPITNDVLGWLTAADATYILRQIEALPKREEN